MTIYKCSACVVESTEEVCWNCESDANTSTYGPGTGLPLKDVVQDFDARSG